MLRWGWLFAFLLAGSHLLGSIEKAQVSVPPVVLAGVPFEVRLSAIPPRTHCELQLLWGDQVLLRQHGVADSEGACVFSNLRVQQTGRVGYRIFARGEKVADGDLRCLSGWVSLLPPLVAVLTAFLLRQVVIALAIGVWVGATLVTAHPFTGGLQVLDLYLVQAYSDEEHITILLFTLLLGGLIGILSRSGSVQGLTEWLSRLVRLPRSAQFATWLMGLVFFFDDYANALFVGTTMRPLCDRYRISREKLSYLVDTTSAPIASLAFISTWIGFEVSLIGEAFQQAGVQQDPYLTFLASIPYRFYPLMALVLPLWLIWLGRDWGPMWQAEQRARRTGQVLREGAQPLARYEAADLLPTDGQKRNGWLALTSLLITLAATLVGLWVTGITAADLDPNGSGWANLQKVLAAADSYRSLLWSAALGCLVAGALCVATRSLSLADTLEAWMGGMRTMFLVVVILGLAWSLGKVCADLQTAQFLVQFLGPYLQPQWIPALTTLVAALISFATGSSWATMSVLFPIVVPLVVARTAGLPTEEQQFFLVATVSSVLGGAIFGDHCSPISDTTVLSSAFSGADHLDHVRTQLPYAVISFLVAWLIGDWATAYGLPVSVALLLGAAVLGLLVWQFGKPVEG